MWLIKDTYIERVSDFRFQSTQSKLVMDSSVHCHTVILLETCSTLSGFSTLEPVPL